jgi:RNA polymerase sigma-70 factor, ECF subfamily
VLKTRFLDKNDLWHPREGPGAFSLSLAHSLMKGVPMAHEQEPTDHELVMRVVQDGDKQAFNALFLRYWTSVWAFLRSYLRLPEEEIEDVAQDIFTRAWEVLSRQRHRGKIPQNFRAWLFAIAKNRAIDEIRKRRRSRGEPLREGHDLPAPDLLELYERLREVWEVLSVLDPVHRECLVLASYGFSLSEIVELIEAKLGRRLQENSVRTYISTARRRLQTHLCSTEPPSIERERR